MDSKLTEIRDLINEKERIENRLAVLLGEADAPKRGRPRNKQAGDGGASSNASSTHAPGGSSTIPRQAGE